MRSHMNGFSSVLLVLLLTLTLSLLLVIFVYEPNTKVDESGISENSELSTSDTRNVTPTVPNDEKTQSKKWLLKTYEQPGLNKVATEIDTFEECLSIGQDQIDNNEAVTFVCGYNCAYYKDNNQLNCSFSCDQDRWCDGYFPPGIIN